MKILIASWGNPNKWNSVTYHFDGEKDVSKTSLKILVKKLKPDLSVVFVGDTLAGSNEFQSYHQLIEGVRGDIRNFIEVEGISDNRLKVVVAPAVGSFENGNFLGNVKDYYYYALFCISELIFRQICESKVPEEIEFILDLTHGINYMPVFLYRALRESLGLVAYFTKARLKVFVSDPVSMDLNQMRSYNINIVEDTVLRPAVPEISVKLTGSDVALVDGIKPSCRLPYDVMTTALAFMQSLKEGLPLCLATFCSEATKTSEFMKKTVMEYRNSVSIKPGEKLVVEKKARFNELFRICCLYSIGANMLTKTKGCFNPEEGVPLEVLCSVADIFSFSRRISQSIINDISGKGNKYSLEKAAVNLKSEGWEYLGLLFEDGNAKGLGNLNERNFYAHSGFERKVTQLKKLNGKVLVRYLPKSVESIKKVLTKEFR